MKIFKTQLQGILEKQEEYEEELEDAARVIVQSMISDGQLWIYGEMEMKGIIYQGIEGVDAIPTISEATINTSFSPMDTLLVFSPNSTSESANKIVEAAAETGAHIIGVASESDFDSGNAGDATDQQTIGDTWFEKCSFGFSTNVKHGLVPTDTGTRIGEPHLLVALYLYYALFFTVTEILEEHES